MFTTSKEKKDIQETEQKMLEMVLYDHDDEGPDADIDEDLDQKMIDRRKKILSRKVATPSQDHPSTSKKRKVIPRASVAEGTLSYSRALTTKHPEVSENLIASDIMTENQLSRIPEFKQNKNVL